MKFKRLITSALVFSMLFGSLNSKKVFASEVIKGSNAKNVIIFIADGMSIGGYTLSRWYQGGKPLATDEIICGLIKTYAADSAITDSAPGGTAFSTGYKSHTGYVGVLADENTMPGTSMLAKEDIKKPVATVLESAKLNGKATGIVSTSEFMHATPADFSAHYPDRSNYDAITEQIVYNNIDVVFGGGYKYLSDRKDKENLEDVLKERGYSIVRDKKSLLNSTSKKVYGLFADKAMAYDLDKPVEQPTLAEMTSKAIDTLSKDEDGFFLMVEGSKVDWAAHANDPVGIVSDILAFDKAVSQGLEYAKKHKDTVVIVTTDHGNSGITMGDINTSSGYDKIHVNNYINLIKKATKTGEGLEKLFNESRSNIVEVMSKYYAINDLTTEEIEAIKTTKAGSMNYTVGKMIAKRSNIGFTTNGHTGEDVILGVYAPDDIRPTGVIDNTDIAKYIANTLKIDLDKSNKELFILARPALEAKGATVQYDTKDVNNTVLVASKGSDIYKFPINKSVAYVNGKEVQLKGLTVYNKINVYLPQDAIDLIK